VWANTQVAQIDAIGRFRDLVPQRICFATSAPQVTDAVLGAGSEALGASCSSITQPGVGFSHSEGDKLPKKFRAAEVTNREVQLIARGELPRSVVDAARDARLRADETSNASKPRGNRRTAVYFHSYIDDPEYGNSLGYVGIAYDPAKRENQHAAGLREFMNTARREVRVEWYDTRAEALAREEEAIKTLKPIWNDQHNHDNPRRRIDFRFKSRRGDDDQAA
jgi:predicted GIY-YIG superfamily endonuclease